MLEFAERSITYDTTTDQPMVARFATLSLGPHFTKHSCLCLVNPAVLLWLLYYSRGRLLLNLLDVLLYVHKLYNIQQDWKIITNGEWVCIWKEAYLKTSGRHSCGRTELGHVKWTLYGSSSNMRGQEVLIRWWMLLIRIVKERKFSPKAGLLLLDLLSLPPHSQAICFSPQK